MSQTENTLDISKENGNLWLTFNKAFLDSMLKEAAKVYDNNETELGDKDALGKGYMFKVALDVDEFDLGAGDDKNGIVVVLSDRASNIWLRVDLNLTLKDHETMASLVIDKLSKAKSLFQTLKK